MTASPATAPERQTSGASSKPGELLHFTFVIIHKLLYCTIYFPVQLIVRRDLTLLHRFVSKYIADIDLYSSKFETFVKLLQ